MPTVYIPAHLKQLAEGQETIDIDGGTVREVIENLDKKFPGIQARLCVNDDLRPGLNVAVQGKVSLMGLLQKVPKDSEVHFLPAIGGG